MKVPRFQGPIAPVFTPMSPEGDILYDRIPAYVDHLVQNKITAIYLNGTSGEFYNMTLEERKKLAQSWLKECKGKIQVILHIGASNLIDTLYLTRHAVHELTDPAPDALAVVVPSYIPPHTVDDLVAYVQTVTKTASNMPFFYYHIPMMTSCKVDLASFLTKTANGAIPNLVGLKFTDNDISLMDKCLKIVPKEFQFMPGTEANYTLGLEKDCKSAIMGVVSFAPGLTTRLTQTPATMESGNTEAAHWTLDCYRLNRLGQVVAQFSEHQGVIPCLKAIGELSGLGIGQPRLPLQTLGEKDLNLLKEELKKIGFFQWNV